MKTKNGQIAKLKARNNPHQLAVRAEKIAARRTVAEQLIIAQQRFGQAVAIEMYRRTFKGRLFFAKQRIKGFFTRKRAA